MVPPPAAPTAAAGSSDWTRDEWVAFADRLLDGARRHASPGAGRITPPGAEGGYGHDVDGLEGFARTFLLAGFRIAGARGEGVDDLIDFYRRGIITGVDPEAADRWVRPDEHDQAKVEAASLALIFDLTREWIWDTLDTVTQQRVIDYLAVVVGDETYPRNNWLWFRIVVETFLRSVGGPWSQADIDADLALHDSFIREDGWLSDGAERSYDHYVGWALHLYPVLWARMAGAREIGADRVDADIARLDRFLQDAVALVGADGSPLIQGRSLIYRFAAAAPFWIGAIAEVPSVSPGALRHAADRIVRHFADAGAPDTDDLLSMGWHDEWRDLAQSYSGPASPYWATKGLVGLLLPADHPVWTAPAELLPAETGGDLRTVRSAGWIVSTTAEDGIVRVINHGADHATAGGELVGDSPLYTRIGYSSAVSPLANQRAWIEPLEQSVALVDAAGAATHRAPMDLRQVQVQGETGVASSSWTAHLLGEIPPQRAHGSGLAGEMIPVTGIETVSIVRGRWEVRLVRVEANAGFEPGAWTLRIGGWALAGTEVHQVSEGAAASAIRGDLVSRIADPTGAATATVVLREDASPLGPVAAVPVLEFPVRPGDWATAVLDLTRDDQPVGAPADVRIPESGSTVTVTWPDGVTTDTEIEDIRIVA